MSGGTPGNRGGTGRPPSAVREAMRLALEERVDVLTEIADNGEHSASERIRAIEVLARYGLGTAHEVSAPEGDPFKIPLEALRLMQRRLAASDNDDPTEAW